MASTVTISAILGLALLASCSGKGAATRGAALPDNGAGSPASQLGPAKFSATIDDQAVSGGAIDELQQQNAAYIVPANGASSSPDLLFYLFDTKVPNDPNFSHSFRFSLPKAAGPSARPPSVTLNVILDKGHLARYLEADGFAVTITSLTAARVAGVFSGKMTLSPDTPNAPKKTVTVTDGSFDIPMATSKLVPS